MKILFYSYAYPNPLNPGLGSFNRTMIAGLASEHEVRVVSPVPFLDVWKASLNGRLPNGLNDPTFQPVRNVPVDYCPWYYTPKLFRNHYGRFMRRSVGTTLKRVMNKFQPDAVLSYWTHPDGEVAVNAAREFGIPAITMVGGSDVLINGRRGSRRELILNVLRRADAVIAVSEDIKQVLIEDGIAAEKLHVVRRGIDQTLYHAGDRAVARRNLGLPDDDPIFVNVGRLVEVKGQVHLINACKLLSDRGVQFRGYLLGDGPLKSSLQQQIDRLGLADKLELKGNQSSSQLAEWYRAADLSVLSSLSEGVPNVLLESLACGTPFVATNVGGIPEIADLNFDFLVAKANPDELADAIAEKIGDNRPNSSHRRRFEPTTAIESAKVLASIIDAVRSERSEDVPVQVPQEACV